ncbi:MAG: hypothetical protein ABI216_07520 [Devosia sp.]
MSGAPISAALEANYAKELSRYEMGRLFQRNYAAGLEQEGVASPLAAHLVVDGIFS